MQANGRKDKNNARKDERKINSDRPSVMDNNTDSINNWFNDLDSLENSEVKKQDSFINSEIKTGPAVGIAELNTLADLFEGEAPDLDERWEQEEMRDRKTGSLPSNIVWPPPEGNNDSGDLTDLLFDESDVKKVDTSLSDRQKDRWNLEPMMEDISSLFDEPEAQLIDASKSNGGKAQENKNLSLSSKPPEDLVSLFGDLSDGDIEELTDVPEEELPLVFDDEVVVGLPTTTNEEEKENEELVMEQRSENQLPDVGLPSAIEAEKNEDSDFDFTDLLSIKERDEVESVDHLMMEISDDSDVAEENLSKNSALISGAADLEELFKEAVEITDEESLVALETEGMHNHISEVIIPPETDESNLVEEPLFSLEELLVGAGEFEQTESTEELSLELSFHEEEADRDFPQDISLVSPHAVTKPQGKLTKEADEVFSDFLQPLEMDFNPGESGEETPGVFDNSQGLVENETAFSELEGFLDSGGDSEVEINFIDDFSLSQETSISDEEVGTEESGFSELENLLEGVAAEGESSYDEEISALDELLDAGMNQNGYDEETNSQSVTEESLINENEQLGIEVYEYAELETMLEVGEDLDSDNEEVFGDLENLLNDGEENLEAEDLRPIKINSDVEKKTISSGGKPQQVEIDFSDLDKLLLETLDGDRSRSPSVAASPKRPKIQKEQTIKVPAKQLDNLSNLMGELVVNRNSLEQSQERMRQFLDNLLHQVMLLSDVGQRMHDLYEKTLLERAIWDSRFGHRSSSVSDDDGGTNDQHQTKNKLMDSLDLDRAENFTPFHLLAQETIEHIVRVRESSSDIEFLVDEADQVTRQLRQVTTQLQEGLTRARMVPFGQTADRLPRAVWEISRNCGKEAELEVEGKDTLIDKMIQEQLYDPMTHLVNNAITHGIETPEQREAIGKPRKGRVTIRTFHQGNQTVISVADDGGGINPEKVKKKAIEKGLISAERAENMSNLDVYDLLFHPGFSTKDQADKFAGRGVGMDVVRTKLNDIRGTISIDSTIGKGTVFTIRLPLTLSISRALCCISDRCWIAFPMDGVEDMLKIQQGDIEVGPKGEQFVQWRGMKLQLRHLRDLLVYNRHLRRGNAYGTNVEEDSISVVVLRSGTAAGLLAVQVDQVLEQQKEIVIKQLEGPMPKPMGIAGVTVLGDGKIVAIADTIELINLASGKLRREDVMWSPGSEDAPPDAIAQEQSEPTVLIVDDSITVRELLSMTFTKAGYRVEQARDGKDAWEKLRSGLPCDLVFCDIEMPRMDGLELLSRMQKDQVLSELPIAMLTSRGASKHKQMAYDLGASGYFTKPYLEDHLLDAASRMLKGEIVGAPVAV